MGRVTGSRGSGCESSWVSRRLSNDITVGSGSNVGLVRNLSSGISLTTRRAIPKRTCRFDRSSQQQQHENSVSSLQLAVNAPQNKAGGGGLVLSGCSADEAEFRIAYVCRQGLLCQVYVRNSGKQINVWQQQKFIDNDERFLLLKLSIILSKMHEDYGVRLKSNIQSRKRNNVILRLCVSFFQARELPRTNRAYELWHRRFSCCSDVICWTLLQFYLNEEWCSAMCCPLRDFRRR